MKLINETTGEVIREGLTPADVRALHAAGVTSMVGEDAESGDSGAGTAGEHVPTDRELEQDGDPTPGDADGGEHREADDDEELEGMTDEELAEAIEEMERAERERESGEWYGVTADDYDEADGDDVRRFERLQQAIEENRTPMGQRRRDRDDRIEQSVAGWRSGAVREELRETGLADEVESAFRKLKTADFPEPSDAGDEVYVDNYVRHLAGDYSEDEFYVEQSPVEVGDRAVSVALDMSGSMDELDAKVAFGALYVATKAIGDDLMGSAFYTSNPRKVGRTTLITAPGEGFEWEHLDAIKSDDLTPTPLGIADAKGLLDGASKREKVLIVITDGIANITTDDRHNSGDAVREAAEYVNRARAEGIKVIGLGVEPVDESMMAGTFGDDGYVMARSDEMADALVEVYRGQMDTADR